MYVSSSVRVHTCMIHLAISQLFCMPWPIIHYYIHSLYTSHIILNETRNTMCMIRYDTLEHALLLIDAESMIPLLYILYVLYSTFQKKKRIKIIFLFKSSYIHMYHIS